MLAHHVRWAILSATEHRCYDGIHLGLSIVCRYKFRFFFVGLVSATAAQVNESMKMCYRFSSFDGLKLPSASRLSTESFIRSWHFSISFSSFLFRFYCRHCRDYLDRRHVTITIQLNYGLWVQAAAAEGDSSFQIEWFFIQCSLWHFCLQWDW